MRRANIFEITHVSCMLVWCDLHVARNVLCTAISRAVVINTRDFTKTLGTSHETHACTALASVKFKSSCTVRNYALKLVHNICMCLIIEVSVPLIFIQTKNPKTQSVTPKTISKTFILTSR